MNWTSGELRLDSGSKIENSGNFDASADSHIKTLSGTLGIFDNLETGEYNKIGSGNTEIDHTFNNAGSLNWTDGDIRGDAGTTINNSGTFNDSHAADHLIHHLSGNILALRTSDKAKVE